MTTAGKQLDDDQAKQDAKIAEALTLARQADATADATAAQGLRLNSRMDALEQRVALLEGTAPPPIDPVDPEPLPEPVDPPPDRDGGVVVDGTYTVISDQTIAPEVGEDGLRATNNRIDLFKAERMVVDGPYYLQSDVVGIGVSLPNKPECFANVQLIDCEVDYMDSLVQIKDDWARYQPPGTPGRINLLIQGGIYTNGVGSDSHGAGLYVEGLSDNNLIDSVYIDRVGWTEDGSDPPEKRSHCIYAQQFGAPLNVRNSWLVNASAVGIEMRRAGTVEDCVFSGCPIAIQPRSEAVPGGEFIGRNIAILDQRNIYDTPSDPSDPLRKGWRTTVIKAWELDRFELVGCLIARRHGEPMSQPIIEVNAKQADVRNVTIVGFPNNGPKILVNGEEMIGKNGNRYIEIDPGIPTVADRKPGETAPEFIERCWESLA